MNHLPENELLELAAGHRLSYVQKRHLAQCPDCTQRLAQIRQLVTLTHEESPITMTTNLQERLWSALPSVPKKRRAILLRPIGLVSGIVLLAGVALFFSIPGSPLRPTPSFAQVEAAMEKIKTVHWTETMEVRVALTYSSNGQGRAVASDTVNVMVYESWGDVANHRLSHTLVSGTVAGAQRYRVVMDATQAWDYWKASDRSMYLKLPPESFQSDRATKIVMDQVILPKDDPSRTEKMDVGDNGTQTRTYSSWKQSDGEREGKKLLKFDRIVKITYGINHSQREVSVWVDPATMQVVRREEVEQQPNSDKIAYRRLAENFRYNETPPPGVFELPKPKVGEHYQIVEAWNTTRDQRADEQARKKVVEVAIQAYSRKDTAGFLALWDFDAVPQAKRATRRAEAKALVREQKPYRSWRAEKVMSAHPGPPVCVRKSETDPFPPPSRATDATVDVNVRGWVTTVQKNKAYPALATFMLTKRSGQWKIQQAALSTKALPEWSWR